MEGSGGVGDVLLLRDRFEQMCVVEIWRERGLKVHVLTSFLYSGYLT